MSAVPGADRAGLRFRLVWPLRALALATGVVTWWRFRFEMNPDGVHYLEIGDGVVRGEWSRLVNSYWSPLYPFLVGVVRRAMAPSLEVEAPIAHAVQLVAWVLGWIAVERLVIACAGVAGSDERGRDRLLLFGGSAYIWYGSEHLARIVTPDLLLTGLVLLATREAVLLVRGARGSALGLGVLLGLAYLAKAVVFPVAAAALGTAILAGAGRGAGFRPLLAAGAGFSALALPWVAVLSLRYGRLTTGDAGRLNYGWYVNEWHGPDAEGPRVITRAAGTAEPPSRFGVARHPVPVVFDEPRVLFAGEGPVSAFPWDSDPAYWEAGLKTRFEPGPELRRIRAELPVLRDALLPGFGAVVAVLLAAALPGAARRAGPALWVAFPMLAGAGLYALVHVEGRLVMPFLLPLAILLLAFGTASLSGRAVPALVSGTLLLFVGPTLHRHVFTAPREDPWELRQRELVAAGLKAGARLAVANPPAAPYEYRRAGLSIHADIRSTPEAYCALPEDRRVSLEDRLRKLGLDAIVLDGSTPAACTGFRRSGPYLVRSLWPA